MPNMCWWGYKNFIIYIYTITVPLRIPVMLIIASGKLSFLTNHPSGFFTVPFLLAVHTLHSLPQFLQFLFVVERRTFQKLPNKRQQTTNKKQQTSSGSNVFNILQNSSGHTHLFSTMDTTLGASGDARSKTTRNRP